jgi:isomerase DpgB
VREDIVLPIEEAAAGPAVVTFAMAGSRPLSPADIRVVEDACDRADDSSAILVVAVLGGTGRPADASPDGDPTIELVSRWERALRRLERLSAPLLAAVSGRCRGTALDVFFTTDLRIATVDTSLNWADDSGEVWPGLALHRLTAEVGVGRSRRLLLLQAARMTAAQALDWEVVDEVADAAAFPAAVRAAGTALRSRRQVDLAILRRLVLDAPSSTADEALGAHLAACDRVLRRRRPAATVR